MNETGTLEIEAAMVLDPLRADHQKVKKLFEQFEGATESEQKRHIVETALKALQEHAYVEEKVLYPAFEPVLDEGQLLAEAFEEHHVMHLLIAELKKMTPADERFDAKFTVLAENVKHHIKEEEDEMFPQVEESDLDWAALAEKVTQAREHFSSKVARSGKQIGKAKKSKTSS
ncbi:MAG: hemerythrin domain-containing protein [Nitrospira sp.]|nr:hemerythrin domain-containing protein [Nitrospira sp.]